MWATSSMPAPASDRADPPASRMAGDEWKSSRWERNQWSSASAPAQREDPPLPGMPADRGRGGRAHDDGRTLVDLHVGGEQLGVRVGDHPVGLGDGDDLVRRAGVPEPGVGIGRRPPRRIGTTAHRCDGGGRRGSDRARPAGRSRRGDRRGWAGRVPVLLGLGRRPPVAAEHGRPGRVGRLHGPRQHRPVGVAAGGRLGVDAVGADQHSHVQLAPTDGQGGGVDQALRVVAPGGGQQHLGRVHAQRRGHRQPRVEVAPAQRLGHPQRLGRRRPAAARRGRLLRGVTRRSPRWRPERPRPSGRSARGARRARPPHGCRDGW